MLLFARSFFCAACDHTAFALPTPLLFLRRSPHFPLLLASFHPLPTHSPFSPTPFPLSLLSMAAPARTVTVQAEWHGNAAVFELSAAAGAAISTLYGELACLFPALPPPFNEKGSDTRDAHTDELARDAALRVDTRSRICWKSMRQHESRASMQVTLRYASIRIASVYMKLVRL